MALEGQAKQVFGLSLVPVGRRSMDQATDGRHLCRARIELEFEMHPRRGSILVENIDKRQAGGRHLFDHQSGERKAEIAHEPLANLDEVIGPACEPANPPIVVELAATFPSTASCRASEACVRPSRS